MQMTMNNELYVVTKGIGGLSYLSSLASAKLKREWDLASPLIIGD